VGNRDSLKKERASPLSAWAQKITSQYEAHKVHLEWAKVIAERYGNLIIEARSNEPRNVLLHIISSDLSIGAMVIPDTAVTAKALLTCTAFIIDLSLAEASIATGALPVAALAIAGVSTSLLSCEQSLAELFNKASHEQKELEAARAREAQAREAAERESSQRTAHDRNPNEPSRVGGASSGSGSTNVDPGKKTEHIPRQTIP
jgi:hypothetical protein